ncbi:MAG: glycosyltransferase [Paludibacteraceae bacterium]
MKILILGSLNSHAGEFAPFITEQAEALRAAGCEVEYFGVVGKGVWGYLKQLPKLRRVIREQHIDIIHAHYGLCCLLANLQRRVPVVSTYHGSDINSPRVMRFSKVAMRLSAWNIFVSKRTQDIAFAQVPKSVQQKSSLIPCGINLPASWQELQNQPIGQQTLKQWVNTVLEPNKKHVLFAGAFDNPVKDPELAKAVVQEINRRAIAAKTVAEETKNEVQLIELKGYTRDQVNALMYTCDALLMTSKTEGSPQVIKEAMACGLPIVSTDVGDVKERIAELSACRIASSRNPIDIANILCDVLQVPENQMTANTPPYANANARGTCQGFAYQFEGGRAFTQYLSNYTLYAQVANATFVGLIHSLKARITCLGRISYVLCHENPDSL